MLGAVWACAAVAKKARLAPKSSGLIINGSSKAGMAKRKAQLHELRL
jgi:hypothetical protein